MEIKIYQINTDRDKNSVKFLKYGYLEKYQDTKDINASIYDEVFSGNVDCEDLEDIYRKFNTIRLLHHLSHMIQNRFEDERKGKGAAIDRKLKRKIDEKKQAHGLRQG